MRQLRIRGLVAGADRVRRELAGPLSQEQLDRLRHYVDATVTTVQQTVAQYGMRPQDLPAPSRRAYEFLAGLDLSQARPSTAAPTFAAGVRCVRYPGLVRDFDALLAALAESRPDRQALQRHIQGQSRSIEDDIARSGIEPWQLTDRTRQIRGWLAMFAQESYFARYLETVGLARMALDKALRSGRFRAPIRVEFRPMTNLYRLKGKAQGTQVWLPTPMIAFDPPLWDNLAELAARRGDKQAVLAALTDKPCQDILAELESLGGVVAQAAGLHHDLAAAFDRVNRRYFRGGMDRPRLTWSQSLTRRKFGHYDPVRDTIMVSGSLDHPRVPAQVVDFVVYHELLHKRFGVDWSGGQARVHTPEFRAAERRFEGFEAAEAMLSALAASA